MNLDISHYTKKLLFVGSILLTNSCIGISPSFGPNHFSSNDFEGLKTSWGQVLVSCYQENRWLISGDIDFARRVVTKTAAQLYCKVSTIQERKGDLLIEVKQGKRTTHCHIREIDLSTVSINLVHPQNERPIILPSDVFINTTKNTEFAQKFSGVLLQMFAEEGKVIPLDAQTISKGKTNLSVKEMKRKIISKLRSKGYKDESSKNIIYLKNQEHLIKLKLIPDDYDSSYSIVFLKMYNSTKEGLTQPASLEQQRLFLNEITQNIND